MSESYNDEICNIVCNKSGNQKTQTFNEDNKEYLKICYYNLYEKYLRKIISYEEWQKIEDVYRKETMGLDDDSND